MNRRLSIIITILMMAFYHGMGQKNTEDTLLRLTPFDFGLQEAETDSARYEVLYNMHVAALEQGARVDYSGINELSIEVTANSNPIPLLEQNDFAGLVLRVKNRTKKCFLFTMKQPEDSIEVDKSMIDNGDFSTIERLDSGLHLLAILDTTLWVNKRAGYDYGASRRDLLMIEHGKAKNTPIASYQSEASTPLCTVIEVTETEKYISNLTIRRSEESTYKAMGFQISGQNNLKVKNVSVYTPASTLMADEIFSLTNCANVTFEDVKIEGSYSQTDKYGYGIMLNNVWNCKFVRLVGHAKWGVFGTNNVNHAVLRDCDINRFDVHCYGRDVEFLNCKFSKLYNQFSSMYGRILFDGCRFVDFTPVLFETTYNAYTGFDLEFTNCVFEVNSSRNFLVSAGSLTDTKNSRPELSEKCWPNVTIKNMTVNVPGDVKYVLLFKTKGTVSTKIFVDYISKVKVDGLKFNYSGTSQGTSFYLSSQEVLTKNTLLCQLNNVNILPESDSQIKQATQKSSYPACIGFNLHRSNARDMIRITKSRLNYNPNANAAYNVTYDNCTLGLVRNGTVSGTARRTYKNCKIYLNCADEKRYYIDNRATYDGCTFIPCDDKMFIDFSGTENDVVIKNCKTPRKYTLIYKGKFSNEELKKFTVKGQR